MAKVEKVTVSLPPELLSRVESLKEPGQTRSEVFVDLLWRGWYEVELAQRTEQYRLAYEAQPETDDERESAEASARELFSGPDEWADDPDQPFKPPKKPRTPSTRAMA